MKKRTMTILIAATCLLPACGGSNTDQASEPNKDRGAVEMHNVDGEKLAVTHHETSGRLFPSMDQFIASSPLVVEARLTKVTPIVAEVQPDPNREGARDGEGPEVYSSLTFETISTLKGTAPTSPFDVVWLSGQRDGSDPKQRIVYLEDNLTEFQLPNGTLRPAKELQGKRFILFLHPGGYPVSGTHYVLGHPNAAVVVLDGKGGAKFGQYDAPPVSPDGNAKNAVPLTESDLKREVSSRR